MFAAEGTTMTRDRFTDDQWECIRDLFLTSAKVGHPLRNSRQMMEGILRILWTGSPWRDLPEVFGRNDRCDAESAARCAPGCGTIMHASLRPPTGGSPHEPSDHALVRSRGGCTTKVHVLCDPNGHPLHCHLTPGQSHEATAWV